MHYCSTFYMYMCFKCKIFYANNHDNLNNYNTAVQSRKKVTIFWSGSLSLTPPNFHKSVYVFFPPSKLNETET